MIDLFFILTLNQYLVNSNLIRLDSKVLVNLFLNEGVK